MGRLLEKLVQRIELDIQTGNYLEGNMLPTIRQLASRYSVSRNTVQLSLRALVEKGRLTVDPKVGYRVNALQTVARDKGLIAYVALDIRINDGKNLFLPLFMDGLRYYGDQLGFSVIHISTFQKNYQEIAEELKRLNVSGVIVSSYFSELVHELIKHNFSVVMVDSFIQDLNINTIMQDNFMGGHLAAKWVLQKKINEIVWVGAVNNSLHGLERYGGFVSGLTLGDIVLKPKNIINVENDSALDEEYGKKIRKVFESCQKPFVVACLWSNLTIYVYNLINEMGLRYGKDVFIIGWCIKEMVDIKFKNAFKENQIPPYITWSFQEMSRMTIDHFTEKVNSLQHKAIRKTVPVSLVLP